MKGELVDAKSALANKRVLLYFSAKWCPPCAELTPQLAVLYEEVNEDEKQMEVIYVGSDDTKEEMDAYRKEKHADWLTVPWTHPLREKLKMKYGTYGGKEQPKWPE